MSGTDYYVLLEIPPTASDETIRAALTSQRRRWGNRANNAPNLKDRQEAELKLAQIGEANKILLDPAAKAQYDQLRSGDGIGIGIAPPPPPPPTTPGLQQSQYWTPDPTPKWPYQIPKPPWFKRKWVRWAVGAFVALIIISAIANSVKTSKNTSNSGNSGNSGSGTQGLPHGATRAAVLGPVVAAIRSCAQSAVLQPANCAQQASASSGTAVIWTLHGDPAAGAQTSYSGHTITVLGHTVMSVSYSDESGNPQLEVDTVSYQATLNWNGHTATVTNLAQLQNEPTPPIVVPRPSVSDAAVLAAVKAAFVACAAITTPTVPPKCPQSSNGDSTDTHIHWSLQADPLLNAKVNYDSSYGILHAVGSYAFGQTYTDSSGTQQSNNEQGTYDAQVTDDNGQLTVDVITAST